jgi:hypothetical protein
MMLGMLPSCATTCRRATASTLPTMSFMRAGRYFSTCTRQPKGPLQSGLTLYPRDRAAHPIWSSLQFCQRSTCKWDG